MSGTDVMVDLETLDTKPSAVILSIGACVVDLDAGKISDHFYRVISVESCLEAGLTESASTKAWWDKQSPEARKVFTDPSISLTQALVEFGKYLKFFGSGTVKLWGNGSDFDNTILIHAYDKIGLDAPWRFYNNRCFRTIKNAMSDHIQVPAREGTYHNALDDAIYQAKILLQLKGKIRT